MGNVFAAMMMAGILVLIIRSLRNVSSDVASARAIETVSERAEWGSFASGAMCCTRCGVVAVPRRITKGTLGIEIVLWLLLLVPGVLYSIWRLTSRYDGCRSCGSSELVALTSPTGREIVAQYLAAR